MFLDEMLEKKYSGMYRGQIAKVDEDIKNGIYYVRVYPMMASLTDSELPKATSNLTVRYSHISLHVDDWVWCFFENENFQYPVIFDLCNFKDSYPKTSDFGTDYGKFHRFDFNDGAVTLEIDEDEGQVKIQTMNDVEITFDKKGAITLIDGNNNTVTLDDKGIDIKDGVSSGNEIKLTSAGIDIKDKNSNEIKMISGEIDFNGSSKYFVTHTELNSALQTLVSTYLNTHMHPTPSGPSSPPVAPMSIDISSSKTTTLKTGG
jgi:hypothetical protein